MNPLSLGYGTRANRLLCYGLIYVSVKERILLQRIRGMSLSLLIPFLASPVSLLHLKHSDDSLSIQRGHSMQQILLLINILNHQELFFRKELIRAQQLIL